MISVVIPTRDRARLLSRALRSLAKQDSAAGRFEILIVDNGSVDATAAVSRRFVSRHPGIRARHMVEPEPGQLFARHRGAREAKGDILAFIDDDMEMDPGWLRAFQGSFADPAVQLVGGRILPRYEARPPAWLKWFWAGHPAGGFCAPLGILDLGDETLEIEPTLAWGGNLAIRRKTLFALGGFHPDYAPPGMRRFEGDGDTGLSRKAQTAGCKALYQPKAVVRHLVPRSKMTPGYIEKWFFYSGIGESFGRLRASGGKAEDGVRGELWASRVKERFERVAAAELSKRPSLRQVLTERFNRAYREGFEFHQAAVRDSPALLRWVLRKDYIDARLPAVKSDGVGDRWSR